LPAVVVAIGGVRLSDVMLFACQVRAGWVVAVLRGADT